MSVAPFYALDIETDTTVNGLDPREAAVVAVAVSCSDGRSFVFSGPEKNLLTELEAFVGTLEPGVLITWNGSVFDLPFLVDRFRLNGVETSLFIKMDPTVLVKYQPLPGHQGGYRARWAEHVHCDVSPIFLDTARRLGVRHALKPVARAVLDVEPIEVDRSRIHQLTEQELKAYATSDTDITLALASLKRREVAAGVDRI